MIFLLKNVTICNQLLLNTLLGGLVIDLLSSSFRRGRLALSNAFTALAAKPKVMLSPQQSPNPQKALAHCKIQDCCSIQTRKTIHSSGCMAPWLTFLGLPYPGGWVNTPITGSNHSWVGLQYHPSLCLECQGTMSGKLSLNSDLLPNTWMRSGTCSDLAHPSIFSCSQQFLPNGIFTQTLC